ncbi:MAG: M48 family metalloprotease [Sphingomonas fennica]
MRKLFAGMALTMLLGGAGYGVAQSVRSISAADKATGAKAHPGLLQEFGGAYTGRQAAYATQVGRKVAIRSGLGNAESEFTVTLLDSSVNNAFAIPGGYVYVTRQLMTLANDEAELASVLGHEVGHVAARHSASRNRTSIFGQIASVAAGVLTGNQAVGQLVGQGAQLVTLRFSRAQEYAADDLGIRYITAAGWDPFASADMLAALNRQTALDQAVAGREGQGLPTWASTHPNGEDRVRRAETQAAKTGVQPGTRPRNRDTYLAQIDGLVWGDDPKQGIVDGQTFRHPQLKIAFTAPAGFQMSNGADAVTVSGSGGQAQFGGGSGAAGLDQHIQQVFAGLGQGAQPGPIQRTTVNGMAAASSSTRAQTQQGAVDVTVFAYTAGTGTYHFLLLTPAGSGLGPFQSMVQSFTRLSDAEAARIRGKRIQIVTVGAGDSVATLARRMAFADRQEQRFRVLNGLEADGAVRAGEKVKLVVNG